MDFSTNDMGSGDKWIIETVEKGYVGEYASLVLESKEKVHIAYYDYLNGDLKHARSGPNGWIIETVDQEGTVGQFLSLAKGEGGIIEAMIMARIEYEKDNRRIINLTQDSNLKVFEIDNINNWYQYSNTV